MRAFRRHIAGWTAAWFLCQAVALSATPACAMAMRADQAALPECCRNLKPGQTCPMHPNGVTGDTAGAPADRACHLCSSRRPLATSLLSLSAGLGITASAAALATSAPVIIPVDPLAPRPLARAAVPDPPPPRA